MSDNGYFKCPNRIAQDTEISANAKAIYIFIRSMEGVKNWNFSARGIASKLKMSPTTANKALQELERNGYLLRSKQASNGRFGAVAYKTIDSVYSKKRQDNTESHVTEIDTQNTESCIKMCVTDPVYQNVCNRTCVTETVTINKDYTIKTINKNTKDNKDLKNNAANIDNTKLVSIATAEETATSSSNPVEFNPILTLEKILGVTCSGYLAEKYIALYEDVGQVYYVKALEKAAKANAKNFKYVEATAKGLRDTGIDFDDIYKKGQPQGKKVTIDDINAWADGKGYMDKEGGFYK